MKKSNKLTATVERIGPGKARQYMKLNDNIRKPNPQKIAQMVEDMKASCWEENGESVKFQTNGRGEILRDGQNRLLAIIESGVTQPVVVVRGISGADYVDIGERRSLSQLMRHQGVPYHTAVAATVSSIRAYRAFSEGTAWRLRRPSQRLLIETWRKYEKQCNKWVPLVHNSKVPKWRAQIAMICILGTCPREYAAAKQEFIDCLASGAELDKQDPCYMLRELMLEFKGRGMSLNPKQRHAIIIKAWNYHREQLLYPHKRLTFKTEGPTAEEFPKIG